MNLAAIAERMGRSKRHVMRLVAQRRFPKPARDFGRVKEWDDRVVERWFANRRQLKEIEDAKRRRPRRATRSHLGRRK